MQRRIRCVNCGSDDHRHLLTVRGNRGAAFIAAEHHVVLCERCGLGFLNPQHEEADYERYYRSRNYKPIRSTGAELLARASYRKLQAAFLLDTLRRLPGAKATSLLDVGCGPGALIAFLRAEGISAEGLEIGEPAIDFARREFRAPIHAGTIFDHPLAGRQFDVVTSTAAIEHFTDPLKALRAMRALLTENGLLYINTQDLLGLVLKNGEGSWFKFVHTFYYTETTLGSLIEQAGFRIIRSWTMPPILKTTLLAPDNFCSGELNIVAVKSEPAPSYRGEALETTLAAYEAARARDRRDALLGRIKARRYLGLPFRRLGRLVKPPTLFGEELATAALRS